MQVTEEFALISGDKIKVASVYGGVPLKAQANEAKAAHVIVATPGRLQDLVDRGLVSLDAVQVLVLDEADRMLDMGFKPQVDRLVRKLREDRQTMFFSATLDGEVGELARRYTHFPARFEGELPAERRSGEIDHRFVPVTQRHQGLDARRAAERRRARPRARLRPHEGRRRPSRREAAPP